MTCKIGGWNPCHSKCVTYSKKKNSYTSSYILLKKRKMGQNRLKIK